ncbi:MAG TPA: hypothetical protein VJT15_02685 [Pyrinomonadaceae bacterium]|nr:hypothetical protein [Pyrinomonadaceae bacterium]
MVLRSIGDYNELVQQLLADNKSAKASFSELKQLFLKAVWELLQLRKEIAPEKLEQIRIDKTVNELDPDFSFEQAINVMLKKNQES